MVSASTGGFSLSMEVRPFSSPFQRRFSVIQRFLHSVCWGIMMAFNPLQIKLPLMFGLEEEAGHGEKFLGRPKHRTR